MTSGLEHKYIAILFPSVNHVMKAEKILLKAQMPIKIIPVPKSISSDCGVCIRIEEKIIDDIKIILNDHFDNLEFRQL